MLSLRFFRYFLPFLLLSSLPAYATEWSDKLVAAAKTQIGVTLTYDPNYSKIAFPNGDVPRGRGVCTDVVIRAYRDAFGIDLQSLVHRDMAAHFALYPAKWGLRAPDSNIDHRRVPNLRVFFARFGLSKPVSKNAGDYQPGDLVTVTLPGNLPHIMLVSDQRSADGTPLVIHNIGRGAQLEDALFLYPQTGHFQYGAVRPSNGAAF